METLCKSLKFNVLFLAFSVLFFASGCDRELKEHPLPPKLKRQLEMQKDPKVQARAVKGTISVAPELADQIPRDASLFIFARQPLRESWRF